MEIMSPEEFAAWRQRKEDEILRIRKESEERSARFRQEVDERTAQFRREMDERTAEFRRKMDEFRQERDRQIAKTERRIDKVGRQIGDWINNDSLQLEGEFAESLEETMRVGDIVLDEIRGRMKRKYEFDLVGLGRDAVVVGEIKRKLLPGDVRRFAEERLPHFAGEFPEESAGRRIFGMVCGEVVVPDAAAEAVKFGLIVLRLQNRKLVVENADTARPVN